MSPDWNAIRLDLVGLDEPTRASLRQMRPFFASALPEILARFYDKVRQYDPSCGIFRDGAMQEAVRMQLQHWNLIGGGDFGLPYLSSVARFCEFNQRAGVAPQWYIGCRLMFVAGQLIAAVETEVQIPRFGEQAQAARDRKAAMVKAIARPTCWIPSMSWHSASAPTGTLRRRRSLRIQDKVLKALRPGPTPAGP